MQKPPKNTIKIVRITAPKLDPLHLRPIYSQTRENYSDLFPRNAKITATNHCRFAQFLARILKESRNSERTFQPFREATSAQFTFFVQFQTNIGSDSRELAFFQQLPASNFA
jgi:hypothetical protein